ncbi:uncharacterized protein DNG_05067 [Cephalotrichum gorgonifer]|uniref:Clr5 domain-containing protein n=1 Tax=Cephalotrichum gorgonifer TaxID=2041049 RepID=A0AAE8MZB2_9PEZI|nr:uncharacterized protein DNG_05067 [Cephalotrichum gorgonifer]
METDWTWDIFGDHADELSPLPGSKRAFQGQFRRWGFPLKQNPVYRDDRLATRVRELWERNMPQREMLRILGEDGFEIKDRELVRLRTRNKWLLRDPRGDSRLEGTPEDKGFAAAESSPDPITPYNDAESPGEGMATPGSPATGGSRKRRRRTRGWAGQPADPPGPPRFPSETTIDEARVILQLDSAGYRAVRTVFQRICEANGVVKKTLAGPERWDATKAELVREVPQLQTLMWAVAEEERDAERRKLALDIICTDVTKRMRDGDKRMTLADAKKVLGINPEEARGLRSAFYKVLAGQEVPVRCKSTAGAGRWVELMGEWVAGSELVRGLLPGDQGSPEYKERWKALDILATDVMKRMRDERIRKEARVRGKGKSADAKVEGEPSGVLTEQGTATRGGGSELAEVSPGSIQASPATVSSMDPEDGIGAMMSDFDHVSPVPPLQLVPVVNLRAQGGGSMSDDSSHHHRLLFESPADIALDRQLLIPGGSPAYVDQPYAPFIQSPLTYSPHPHHHHMPLQQTTIAVYLRLHPSSTYVAAPAIWIATLSSHSLQELRHVAAEKFGDAATCVAVEGVLRDGEGGECALGIGGDEELGAYLAHLGGGTPTFNITLAWRG